MSYSIWKWLNDANLPARGAGIIVALIYLAIGAIITLVIYWLWPGPPQWKYSDSVPAWEVVMVILAGLWIVWFFWLAFWGEKKFKKLLAAELALEASLAESTRPSSSRRSIDGTRWD